MRSEQEMFDLILNTAQEDERIRAVMMNGSRANPNAPRDFFQDYDIVYFVTDAAPYTRNLEWIKRFGELMILQLPDDMADPPPVDAPGYCYLMQFSDGNRIDLSIFPVDKLDAVGEGQPDDHPAGQGRAVPARCRRRATGITSPSRPPPSSSTDCTNEFWWVSPYAAKGLWRDELPYAKHMADSYVREQLDKMLAWYVGVKTDFQVSPGKDGKYLKHILEPELYSLLLQTYADADTEHSWEALLAMAELFRRVAIPVAEHFGYEYPYGDDQRVSAHLRHVRRLPREAQEMY